MAICTFCGTSMPPGTGKMFVKKDSKVLWFCSRKCEKNLLKLKRTARTQGWTQEAKHFKKQRMAELAHHGEAAEAKPAEPKAKKAPAKKAKKEAVKAAPAEE